MTKEKWETFKSKINAEAEKETYVHPQIRWGQAIFNIARSMFEEVEWLRATPYDCFHDSDKTGLFLDELGKILMDRANITVSTGSINSFGDTSSCNLGSTGVSLNFGVNISIDKNFGDNETAEKAYHSLEVWVKNMIFENPKMIESLMERFS
jgi:hypothetical protein